MMLRSSLFNSTLSLGLLLVIWQLASLSINSPALPSPILVLSTLNQAIQSAELLHHLGITLLRLATSFFLAMILGTAIGLILGRHHKLNTFFDSWLIILLNIPALVTIILCYIWFGLIETAAILAVVINKLPNVIVTIREGARNLDDPLIEMAKAYHFGRYKTLVHVILPQLYPYIMASARTGLALIWKIILVVEMLGRSDGMGYQIHLFFQLFDIASIMAYTVSFIVIIQLIETALLKPLDKKTQRWK
ncbi:MAG: ABC transporter permease [Cycloclasticus sp.]|nr:ABC transporter permease [Cycloclasticus sp.]MBG96720.1 ABC transporter permease [Cycloclasticus sp.]HAI97483.1 ABC transporter permease [Methylococcaceae bacterium]